MDCRVTLFGSRVDVCFVDGIVKRYDVSGLVGKGVFAPLSDPDVIYENGETVSDPLEEPA